MIVTSKKYNIRIFDKYVAQYQTLLDLENQRYVCFYYLDNDKLSSLFDGEDLKIEISFVFLKLKLQAQYHHFGFVRNTNFETLIILKMKFNFNSLTIESISGETKSFNPTDNIQYENVRIIE